MIDNENDLKLIKRSQNSFPETQNLDFIKNNNSDINNSLKKSNSNHLIVSYGEEVRSKSSSGQKNKYKKKMSRKSESFKSKKKEKDKLTKFLKKERLKIPTGKRMSQANDVLKFNLNNIDKILKSIEKKNAPLERKDSYGNKINKENKKNVHIRFVDKLPTNRKKLIEIIPIESFKEYNLMEKIPNEGAFSFNKCCIIF